MLRSVLQTYKILTIGSFENIVLFKMFWHHFLLPVTCLEYIYDCSNCSRVLEIIEPRAFYTFSFLFCLQQISYAGDVEWKTVSSRRSLK